MRTLNLLRSFLLAFSTLFLLAAHGQSSWLPGEVLLYLGDEATATQVEQDVNRALPAGVELKSFAAVHKNSRYQLLRFSSTSGISDRDLEKLVARLPGVGMTSLNYRVKLLAQPNDPQYGDQWNMGSINVEPVWELNTGGTMANGRRIAVGIMDELVQTTHPDLAANISPASPYTGPGEEHGTEVAGVVGAVGNNGIGISGVSWDVDLVSLGGLTSFGGALEGFEAAVALREAFNSSGGGSGALIVSVTASWTFPGVDCGFSDPLFADMAAAGILVITTGDNSSVNLDLAPEYPSSCISTNNIVVTSIGPSNEIPYAFGNSTVHLLAPGIDIPTTELGGDYITTGGNSFAVPHVAGAVALLYANDHPQFATLVMNDPVAASLQVKQALLDHVTPVSGASAKTITGGKLNVSAAYNALISNNSCEVLTISFTNTNGITPLYYLLSSVGDVLTNGSASTFTACLPNACFVVYVVDGNNEFLSGNYTIRDALGAELDSGSYTGVFQFASGTAVSGCTDPNASNYDPNATCDDGSCCTSIWYTDADGDGYGAIGSEVVSCLPPAGSVAVGGDCDDLDNTIHPGVEEVCDGIDNDCDGGVDNVLWYTDADGDGFGDGASGVISCTQLPGTVSNAGDCNDADASAIAPATLVVFTENPDDTGTAHYVILNGANTLEGDLALTAETEGVGLLEFCFGSGCVIITITSLDVALYETTFLNLPDSTQLEFQTADGFSGPLGGPFLEICDGIDNDCDGQIDEGGVCGCLLGSPCDDGNACTSNDVIGPDCECIGGPPTVCDDGNPCTIDSCDPTVGCVFIMAPSGTPCDDGDPLTVNDVCNGAGSCFGTVVPPFEICDGLDNDGDGLIDEGLGLGEPCGCGGVVVCDVNGGVTCSVSVIEICDGIDNDCNGLVDEGVATYADIDADGFGDPNNMLPCGTPGVSNNLDCDDSNAAVHPGALEICDGIDNDCNGLVDEGFATYADNDADGFGDPNNMLPCGTPGVSNNLDCDDSNAAVHPGAVDICDGIDNDCNGLVDEDFPQLYADADGDGFGDPNNMLPCGTPGVSNNSDCDDTNATINPDAVEICDGLDNNCDGQIDEGGVCGCLLGSPCDDGNACTSNDVMGPDCECIGGPPTVCDDGNPCTIDSCDPTVGCVFIMASSGTPCDDGDPNTTNDICFNGVCSGTLVPDADGDGFNVNQGDCDDNNADINPAAFEICDGVDNNCNGQIDEGVCSQEVCDGLDNDGDGLIDAADPSLARPFCEKQLGVCGGTVKPADHCVGGFWLACSVSDYTNGSPEFEVTETSCDGLDNDCDGAVDEDVNAIWYVDLDGDGYGDATSALLTCEAPPGYVAVAGDCDDNDANLTIIGATCDDGNENTIADSVTSDCVCIGTLITCAESVTVELRTDVLSGEASWEIIEQGTGVVMCQFSVPVDGITSPIVESCCLPQGCYRLCVMDSGGDGFVSGAVSGGYLLRETNGQQRRIIDNVGNFNSGYVSQISNAGAFCVPIGDYRPIFVARDKMDWVSNEYLVCEPDEAVSAVWTSTAVGDPQRANSGYQFWFFDPNGSFSYRRGRYHSSSDGFGPASEYRACHMRINNWTLANQIPAQVLMNVRIRTRVNGVYGEFGPAYRFMIDPVAAACPLTKLNDIPEQQFLSCNSIRIWGGNNYVHARQKSGANKYQFRFRLPAEGFVVVRSSTTYFLKLNWATDPLQVGKTYDVDVRMSKDGGATWCTSGPSWGEVCKLTITGQADGNTQNLTHENRSDEGLGMWPNPNDGDQLWLDLKGIEAGVEVVTVEMFAMSGKRIKAHSIPIFPDSTEGHLSTTMDLQGDLATGIYLVRITAGTKHYTERLVIMN